MTDAFSPRDELLTLADEARRQQERMSNLRAIAAVDSELMRRCPRIISVTYWFNRQCEDAAKRFHELAEILKTETGEENG